MSEVNSVFEDKIKMLEASSFKLVKHASSGFYIPLIITADFSYLCIKIDMQKNSWLVGFPTALYDTVLHPEFIPAITCMIFLACCKMPVMYKLLLLSLLLNSFSTNASFAQQKKIRLLVRGDDMGFSHSGNKAIIKTYKEGIERSVEVIVPSPWFPEAVKMLEENPGLDAGIHLVLTSEWDNIKWRPLTDCPSLKDEDGYFYPMLWPNKNYPGAALLQKNWKLEEIEKEWRAQIELAIKKIPRLSHISGHMGCTDMNDAVRLLAKKLAKEYKIDIDPSTFGVKNIGYGEPSGTAEKKLNNFIKMLDKLEPGNTYLFVDHPGLDDAELRAIHHIGYEKVAADRQGVTDTWTHPKVKEMIRKKGIELISYKDLLK